MLPEPRRHRSKSIPGCCRSCRRLQCWVCLRLVSRLDCRSPEPVILSAAKNLVVPPPRRRRSLRHRGAKPRCSRTPRDADGPSRLQSYARRRHGRRDGGPHRRALTGASPSWPSISRCPRRSKTSATRVRTFMDEEVRPTEQKLRHNEADRNGYISAIAGLRQRAHDLGLWNPHLPKEWGGMGLGQVAMAFVSAEAGRTRHAARTSSTRRRPTKATCTRCCTTPRRRTEGEVPPPARRGPLALVLRDDRARGRRLRPDAASRRTAVKDGDDWVINGHKWFISGAKGARFAILIARTDPDADPPQARNSAFLVDLPAPGLGDRARHRHDGRAAATTARSASPTCACRPTNMLGERGHGHLLGPVPPRAGAAGALHALDRQRRGRAGDARRPRAASARPTARCSPTSRRSSG